MKAEAPAPSRLDSLLALDQGVLDAIPVAVCLSAADGAPVRFNRRASALWGRSPRPGDSGEQFGGAYRLSHADGRPLPPAATPMAAALRTGEPQRGVELAIERPDGTRVVATIDSEPLRGASGAVEGAISTFHDVTARSHEATQLREAERRHRQILESLPAAIYTTDAAGRITFVNRAATELVGREPTLGTDQWCVNWRLYRPDGTPLPLDECPMAVALREGRPIRGQEIVAERPDGARVAVQPYPTPMHDESGALVGAVNLLVDIGERKRAEEILRAQSAIIESSDDAIASKDLDGVLVSWNKGAERLFGYTADEVIGQPVTMLIPEDHLDEEPEILARIRRGERIDHYETVRRRKDGTLVDISLTVSPVHGADGRVIGASKIARDITARRQAEAALAHRVAEQMALYRFTDRLQRAAAAGEIHDAALDAIVTALRCERAAILLVDDAGTMRFAAWRGLSDAYRRAVEGHSPWTADTVDPQPICYPDAAQAELPKALAVALRAEGIGALAFMPLVAYGRLIGKFMIYYPAPRPISEAEVALGLAIGRQLCFGLERLRADTARRRAEAELRLNEARERARAAELQAIMEAVPAVIWIARDAECRTLSGNRASYDVLRLPPDANLSPSAQGGRGGSFQVLGDGRVLAPHELPVQRAARGEDVRDFEQEIRFDDGSSRVLLGNARPLRDDAGLARGAVAAFIDITDRKRAEEQRDLLIAELSHRVKNTLATVISIARLSFLRNPRPEEAYRSFEARIRALAQTHGRLAEASWSGVPFDTILRDELAPYRRDDGANLRLAGPRVSLTPKCALTLGMAMHELATNAAKYGALSAREGTVAIAWQVDPRERQLRIRWGESGGPMVAPPAHSGFGRLLLERAVASDLRGEVHLDFAAEGLTCRIALPLDTSVARLA